MRRNARAPRKVFKASRKPAIDPPKGWVWVPNAKGNFDLQVNATLRRSIAQALRNSSLRKSKTGKPVSTRSPARSVKITHEGPAAPSEHFLGPRHVPRRALRDIQRSARRRETTTRALAKRVWESRKGILKDYFPGVRNWTEWSVFYFAGRGPAFWNQVLSARARSPRPVVSKPAPAAAVPVPVAHPRKAVAPTPRSGVARPTRGLSDPALDVHARIKEAAELRRAARGPTVAIPSSSHAPHVDPLNKRYSPAEKTDILSLGRRYLDAGDFRVLKDYLAIYSLEAVAARYKTGEGVATIGVRGILSYMEAILRARAENPAIVNAPLTSAEEAKRLESSFAIFLSQGQRGHNTKRDGNPES